MSLFDSATLERCRGVALHTVQRNGQAMAMVRKVVNEMLNVRHINRPSPTTLVESKATGKTVLSLIRSVDQDGTYYRVHQTGTKHYSIANALAQEMPGLMVRLGHSCGLPLTRSMLVN